MIICGDALMELRKLPDESVHCCVTSPPYWGLRDYGIAGQLGLEKTPEEYVARLVDVFREVRRVLRDDGTLWLNLGDSYWGGKGQSGHADAEYQQARVDAGISFSVPSSHVGGRKKTRPQDGKHDVLKPKDLCGIPWRTAFALQADGWWLRQDIIWAKPNPMPESVRDRCTRAHEYIFMLSKSAKYWYDADAIKEPAIYFDDDRKGRALENHKRMLTDKVSGTRPRSDKQRGHGRRHAGFNDRWDQMNKQEQCSAMRNLRSVWAITTKPLKEAHFATFPPEIPERCIKAGCPVGGVVLDPFFGAGTTGMVAKELGRDFIGIELNPEYCRMAENRIARVGYQIEMVGG
jgi:DNA modification methylase